MSTSLDPWHEALEQLELRQENATLVIQTLGVFNIQCQGTTISSKAWGRDKTIQLLQYFITNRHRRALHKEQIIDRLWPDAGSKDGDRDFKVALHGINKILEPERDNRSETQYIRRQGLSYYLELNSCWIDADIIEEYIRLANTIKASSPQKAIDLYQKAIDLHHGSYLPERHFEDWSSEERERLQVLILGCYIDLAELRLPSSAMESIRLTQQALHIDPTWEDAYRIQMQAYFQNGNRPAAIKTYQQCCDVLEEEFGIAPLPHTKKLYQEIMAH